MQYQTQIKAVAELIVIVAIIFVITVILVTGAAFALGLPDPVWRDMLVGSAITMGPFVVWRLVAIDWRVRR